MGWKDWPYWIKGGIIGILLSLAYFLIILIIYLIYNWPEGDYVGFIIYILFGTIISTIGVAVALFIIGAIIGLIVGKIKK